MNEMLSPLRGRIDLRIEPPFRLGRLRVSPSTLEVSSPEGAVALEPRVMQVLVALHRGRGEAVSREELSDLCWDGRIVGEDALNRSVSRLRKALAAEPTVAVDTIPKVGYRLRLDAAAAPAGAAQPASPPERRQLAWWIVAGIVALAAVAAGLLYLRREPAAWTASTLRPVTREAGVETEPALSPQGQWLAYAGGPGFYAPRDLYLRGLSLGEAAPLRLTATPADEHAPAWSPDGTRLAFARAEPGKRCAIVVVEPPRGAERVVGGCRQEAFTSLAWTGPDEIVFRDRVGAVGPRRLFTLQVRTGAMRALTDPPADSLGDAGPTVSPDGRRIAFRRSPSLGADAVHVLDLRTGRDAAVAIGSAKAVGLAWSADSRTLFFTSNQDGDFGLWSTEPGRRKAARRVTVGLVWLGNLSADRRNRLVLETVRTRTELVAALPGGRIEALTTPSGLDWDPDVAADGSLVYVSDASGAVELWLRRPGPAAVQLTRFGGSYLFAPRWSPDGRQVAFLGVADGRSDVYVIRADGGGLRRLTTDGGPKGTVAWAGDAGGLVYSLKQGGRWRLFRLDAEGRPAGAVAGGVDVAVLRRAPDGTLYARTSLDNLIRRVDLASGRLEPAGRNVAVGDLESWAATSQGVYWMERSFEGRGTLWFTDWTGARRAVAVMAFPHRQSLAIRPSDGAPLMGRMVQNDVDIVRLDVTR